MCLWVCACVCARVRARVCVVFRQRWCVCVSACVPVCARVIVSVCLYLCARCPDLVIPGPEFKQQSMFAFVPLDKSVCPAETPPVPSFASCEVAAAVAGKPYGGSVSVNFVVGSSVGRMPGGCVWWPVGGSFYFNTYSSGANRASGLPVCAGTLHGCTAA